MNTKGKIIIGIVVLLLFSLLVWAVRTVPAPPAQQEQPERQHVMKYENNTLSEERDGKKIWELTAESMDIDTDTQNATLNNLTGTFYEDDGKEVHIEAPHGFYEPQSKNVKLDGGIKVETTDGASLVSDELEWEAESSILKANGDAKVSREDMKASGDSIESGDGFSKFKITGHAHIEKGNKS